MTKRRRPAARTKSAGRTSRGRAFALAPELTIAEAGALKTRLVRALGAAAPVRLDASKTRRIDTSCFQLLLAFMRDAQAAGKPVTWTATAPEFAATAKTLGLTAALGIP